MSKVECVISIMNGFESWQNYVNEIGDWVLCRLSMKKRSIESGVHEKQGVHSGPRLMFDFMMLGKTDSSTSSSCSSSNNIIEVSSNASDHEETSGGYTYF